MDLLVASLCRNVIACPSLKGLGEDNIRRIIEKSQVDTIIHTAAIFDIGEREKNPDASYIANVLIPVYLSKASKNIKLICFSSDQVYSGTDGYYPFTEDMVKPNNIYAKHELEMENRVLDIDPNAVMLRAERMYEITKELLSVIGKDIMVEDISSRHNSWMNCEKAIKYGVIFSNVEDGLEKFARDYGLLK